MPNNIIAFNSTAVGSNHLKTDKICEDSSVSHFDEKFAIAIVADGHGSDNYPRTDKGSKFATDVAYQCVQEFINVIPVCDIIQKNCQQDIFSQLAKNILLHWHSKVEEDAVNNPFAEEELDKVGDKYKKYYLSGEKVAKAYGTTLIVVAVMTDYWFGLHIGDGKCVEINALGEFFQPIPWDESCQSNVTTSICDSDASEEFRFFVGTEPPMAVFLGSDGVDDSYSNDEDIYSLYRSILSIFGEHGLDEGIKEVDDYLPILSKRGSGDDISIAGIINMDITTERLELLKAQTDYYNAVVNREKANQAIIAAHNRLEYAEKELEKKTKDIEDANALHISIKERVDSINLEIEQAKCDLANSDDAIKNAKEQLSLLAEKSADVNIADSDIAIVSKPSDSDANIESDIVI